MSESGTSSDDTEQCQRCEDDPATSKFTLGANYDGSMTSEFEICNDCVRSLGKWYDEPGTEQSER